jgi:hypothetical protein
VQSIVRLPGAGEAIRVVGNTVVIKVHGDDTAGRYSVLDYTAAPTVVAPRCT